ncbi:MAG TPA: wax ester/triacylglycerol synthase domain-containing protein [Acidimicrobiia bacterium]|nr:wax ester/triacylglycerol synthase domain-containing protein [Acidimicrobiia bacterium]
MAFAGEPLDTEDARIWHLESATIAGHTGKVAVVDRVPGVDPLDGLRCAFAERLTRVPRCCECVEPGPGDGERLYWRTDDTFDVDRHVRRAPAADGLDRDGLLALAGELMAARLDRDRPLWSVDVVPALADGTWALVWRVHHCMADGMTLMRWADELLWDPTDPPAAPASTSPPPVEHAAVEREHARARWRHLAEMAELAEHAPGALARELRPVEVHSPFAGTVGTTRRLAFARCSLDDLRAIGHATGDGTTVNDALLTAVGGGIRRWADARGIRLPAVRVKVPVSLHVAGEHDDLGNRDSFMFVDVPLGHDDPLARLRAVHRETRRRKQHDDAHVIDALERSRSVGRAVTRVTMSPHEFMVNVSNVPGPRTPRSVLGGRVRELYSIAEVAPHHALRVSAVSLAGTMFVGLNTDPAVVPDVAAIAAGIEQSAGELLHAVGAATS